MLIEYKNVTVCQKDGIPVLKDVDFHVSNGEFVYIIGKVGSGKSSLLKTIYAELFIDEGEEAKVLDHDMLTLKLKQVPVKNVSRSRVSFCRTASSRSERRRLRAASRSTFSSSLKT